MKSEKILYFMFHGAGEGRESFKVLTFERMSRDIETYARLLL